VTSKPEVIAWLKRSLEAVKTAHLAETPSHLSKKVKIEGRDSTVDAMYLRIIMSPRSWSGGVMVRTDPSLLG
jgi:hypothetical protein